MNAAQIIVIMVGGMRRETQDSHSAQGAAGASGSFFNDFAAIFTVTNTVGTCVATEFVACARRAEML